MHKHKKLWDSLYSRNEQTATSTLQGKRFSKSEWLEQSWHIGSAILREVKKIKSLGCRSKVLDLGCGSNGRLIIPFLDNKIKCFGVDISGVALKKLKTRMAKLHIKNGALCQGDVSEALPFHDNTFDAVLNYGVVCHIAATEAFLKECARVTKRGGVVFCGSFLNIYHPSHLSYYFINKIKRAVGIKVTLFSYQGLSGIRRFLNSSGLEIKRIDKVFTFIPFYDTIVYPEWALKIFNTIKLMPFKRVAFK